MKAKGDTIRKFWKKIVFVFNLIKTELFIVKLSGGWMKKPRFLWLEPAIIIERV